MSSEDYLIRYFRQLGKVLLALLGLYEKKEYQQAIDEINQVLDTWFALPVNEIDKKTPEELLETILNSEDQQIEKAKSVAELLYQKAYALRAMEKTEKAKSYALKALLLYKKVDEVSGDFSIEIQQKIAELDQWSGAGSLENC